MFVIFRWISTEQSFYISWFCVCFCSSLWLWPMSDDYAREQRRTQIMMTHFDYFLKSYIGYNRAKDFQYLKKKQSIVSKAWYIVDWINLILMLFDVYQNMHIYMYTKVLIKRCIDSPVSMSLVTVWFNNVFGSFIEDRFLFLYLTPTYHVIIRFYAIDDIIWVRDQRQWVHYITIWWWLLLRLPWQTIDSLYITVFVCACLIN